MLDKNDMKMLREMMEATVKETVEATFQKAIVLSSKLNAASSVTLKQVFYSA